MWNFENTKPANKAFLLSWFEKETDWYEIYQFKRYYYIIKFEVVYNDFHNYYSNYNSTVSFFNTNGEKFFDMEIKIFKHKDHNEAVEKKIIRTINKIAKNDSYWDWFFLAKKIEIWEETNVWKIEDIHFYIPNKDNKNKIKEVVKKWVYQVICFENCSDSQNASFYTFLFKKENVSDLSFFFSSQEIKEVKSLLKTEIGEVTYYSNKNTLTDEYYTISNYDTLYNVTVYYKPLQILFSFFEQELEKKWVKNYDILLWCFDKYSYKEKYSRISLLFFKLLISVDWKIDENLTKELLDSYEKDWGILKERNWEKNLICFLDNEFSPIYSFDRKIIENEFDEVVDLWNNYFYFKDYFDSDNWKQNHIVCKYSFKEEKFIIIEEITTIVDNKEETDKLIKYQFKTWFCYINNKAELKLFIKWIGEYTVNIGETFWIKDFKKSDAHWLETTDDWKNIFISYKGDFSLYLILKNWKFIKKIFKRHWENDIQQNSFQEKYSYYCPWFEITVGLTMNSSRKNFYVNIWKLLSVDWDFNINCKKMFNNFIYLLSKVLDYSSYYYTNWYRIIYWLKWCSYIHKQGYFDIRKEMDKSKAIKKENIFSKWVFELQLFQLNPNSNNDKKYFYTTQNYSIEKENKKIRWKHISWLSIWKIWFYE